MPLPPTAPPLPPRPSCLRPLLPQGGRGWSSRAAHLVAKRAMGWPPTAHAGRVACLAAAVARALGLSPAQVREAYLAGLLHDSGKLLVARRVRHKAGPLDPQEWRQMQRHPVYSARLLRGLPGLPRSVRQAVRHHHERLDGSGYPGGLAGDAVPLLARILAACDVYDALSSPRSYKAAWPAEAVWAELSAQAECRLDSGVLAALKRCVAEEATPPLRV